MGSESPDMLETLRVLETYTNEMSTATVRAMDEDRANRMSLERMSKELYEILVISTEGEAKLMVRNVISQDGVQAWHRLYRHYNRRTFARVLRVHKEAMHPKPVKDMNSLISHVVEWEDRWNRMAKEHKNPLPVIWKMAALMELCPPEVQDVIYQNVDEINEDYDRLKQKIITWASNKVESDGVPMDIGKVENEEYEGYDVGAVGWGTHCYNCGGWGHLSRECPSEKKKGGVKGDGKGNHNSIGKGGGKDSGKGGGKGGGKDSGKGGKSSGKGYQGTCYNCGRVGHKAWECRSGKQVGAVDEEEEEGEEVQAGAVEIGTVWNVGGVECCRDFHSANEVRAEKMMAEKMVIDREVKVKKIETRNVGGVECCRDFHGVNGVKAEKMMIDREVKVKKIEITVDSGAGASCWPEKLLKRLPMMAKDKGVRFKAANGTELKYHGTKNIKFQVGGKGMCDMRFHVTDTTKPLASAAAIAKMGNRVVLEQGPGKAYIENIATGQRLSLRESGGTYVLDAECFTDPVFRGRG